MFYSVTNRLVRKQDLEVTQIFTVDYFYVCQYGYNQ